MGQKWVPFPHPTTHILQKLLSIDEGILVISAHTLLSFFLRALPQLPRVLTGPHQLLSFYKRLSLSLDSSLDQVGVRKFHALPPASASASAYFKRSWLWEEGLIRGIGISPFVP